MVTDTGGGLGGQQIRGRGAEELHGRPVVEGRRVRHVDDGVGAGQHLGEALAGEGVHPGGRRGGNGVVAVLGHPTHHLRPDQSGAPDHNDLHVETSSR